MARGYQSSEINQFKVDGQMVRVIQRHREGDGTKGSNRLPSYQVFTKGVYRGVYFRINRGEPRHTEHYQAPQAWYCRPTRLDVERDAPVIGPFDKMLDAISALLKCHDSTQRKPGKK